MKLTREQAIAEHRKMWNWIADKIEECEEVFDIDIIKIEYLTLNEYKGMLENCFLCEYARKEREKRDFGVSCDYCPITRLDGSGCLGGLYHEVRTAENWKEQAKLARQIANLPEREES